MCGVETEALVMLRSWRCYAMAHVLHAEAVMAMTATSRWEPGCNACFVEAGELAAQRSWLC